MVFYVFMNRDNALFTLILIGVFLLGALVALMLIPNSEPIIYTSAPMVPINFEDKKECRFNSFSDSYYADIVNELSDDVDDAEDDLDDAEDRLDYAIMTGDVNLIAKAENDVDEAEDDLDDAEDELSRAKRDYNNHRNEMMYENC